MHVSEHTGGWGKILVLLPFLAPQRVVAVATSNDSVAVSWGAVSSPREGIRGFVAIGRVAGSSGAVANCTTPSIRDVKCTIQGLLPSVEYSITVAALKVDDFGDQLLGEESEPVFALTCKIYLSINLMKR